MPRDTINDPIYGPRYATRGEQVVRRLTRPIRRAFRRYKRAVVSASRDVTLDNDFAI